METSPNITAKQAARIYAMYFGAENETPNSEGECNYATLQYMVEDFPKYKLRLTPLADISDDDARIAVDMYGCIPRQDIGFITKASPISKIRQAVTEIKGHSYSVHEFLLQRGYAVRLFIAPDHPDNWKNAIELGLAVKA